MPAKGKFLDEGRPHGVILVNWQLDPFSDLVPFAAGYRNAAQELTGSLSRAVAYPDHRGYPIVFLYRHAIELYLKALLFRAVRLLDLETDRPVLAPKILTEHSLTRLLSAVEPILNQLDSVTTTGYTRVVPDISDLVRDLHELDPGSYSFRYPMTTKGAAANPSNLRINVLVFAEKMDYLIDMLSGACMALEHEFSETAEARFAVEQFLNSLPDGV